MNQSCSLGTLLHGTVWRKSTNTQDKPGHLWVSAGCELSSSHQTSGSCADVIHKPTSEKEDRKEILPREQCSQPTTGSHKARWDKSFCLSLGSISSLEFPPQDKHTEIARVTGDAPGT